MCSLNYIGNIVFTLNHVHCNLSIVYMVKWCTFASEYNMLVLSANYITFLYSCYLGNNPSSNDIIHICCQLFSNFLR